LQGERRRNPAAPLRLDVCAQDQAGWEVLTVCAQNQTCNADPDAGPECLERERGVE
jgi:hypothetical protein